ncbi:MAG: FlgD immunoglobulin-like domain containing protein [Candidatus Eisenbacteria bacterium]
MRDPHQFETNDGYYRWLRHTLDSLAATPSKMRINVSHARSADSVHVSFDVVPVDTAGGFALYMAVVEDTNGIYDPPYSRIFRDMIPGGSGHGITLTMGDSLQYTWSYRLPLGQEDVHTMIFVQKVGTKKIFQAAYAPLNELVDVAGGAPLRVVLEPNAPNPFNPSTTIRYHVDRSGPVRLTVYDPAGRLVARLHDGPSEAGSHSVVWDGRDLRGSEVGSGVYLYRLDAERVSFERKMILVR